MSPVNCTNIKRAAGPLCNNDNKLTAGARVDGAWGLSASPMVMLLIADETPSVRHVTKTRQDREKKNHGQRIGVQTFEVFHSFRYVPFPPSIDYVQAQATDPQPKIPW